MYEAPAVRHPSFNIYDKCLTHRHRLLCQFYIFHTNTPTVGSAVPPISMVELHVVPCNPTDSNRHPFSCTRFPLHGLTRQSTASKRRSGVPETTAADQPHRGGMGGGHRKRAANAPIEKGRWPRELPWLVTPPPVPTQNVTSSIPARRLATTNGKKCRNPVSGEVHIVGFSEESHGSLAIGHDHGRAKRRAMMSEVGSSPSSASNSGRAGDRGVFLRRRDNVDGERVGEGCPSVIGKVEIGTAPPDT